MGKLIKSAWVGKFSRKTAGLTLLNKPSRLGLTALPPVVKKIPRHPAPKGAEQMELRLFCREEQRIMIQNVLMLAQEEGSALFNLRNGILLLCIIVILVAYKVYKNKTMS